LGLVVAGNNMGTMEAEVVAAMVAVNTETTLGHPENLETTPRGTKRKPAMRTDDQKEKERQRSVKVRLRRRVHGHGCMGHLFETTPTSYGCPREDLEDGYPAQRLTEPPRRRCVVCNGCARGVCLKSLNKLWVKACMVPTWLSVWLPT
jgi:hypothetical protein